MNNAVEEYQRKICHKYGAKFFSCDNGLKVGVSLSLRDGGRPIHGMRVGPEGGTAGWYIWSGEFSEAVDFFKPLHVSHLDQWAPLVLPYLGLPPGWRFLISEVYEDVWHDPELKIYL